MKFKRGFSLLELLLVVAIVAGIFAFSAPFGMNFYRNQLLGDVQSNLIDALQRARHNAILQKNDSNFGVHIVSGSYTLFQTPDLTYANRVSAQDEVFPIVNNINFTGPANIIFSKFTGAPSATGTIAMSFDILNKGIIVDSSGGISKNDIISSGLAVSDGLVSYWAFDGNANDSVSTNNGTVNGVATTTGVKGFASTAYSFNGSSNINMAHPANLNITGSITFICWIKTTQSASAAIFQKHNAADPYNGYTLMSSRSGSGTLDFYTSGGGFVTFGSGLNDGTWHLIAITGDGTSGKFYKDSSAPQSFTYGAPTNNSAVNLFIGSNNTNNAQFFNGAIDNARIYNRALPVDEILTIYNSEKP